MRTERRLTVSWQGFSRQTPPPLHADSTLHADPSQKLDPPLTRHLLSCEEKNAREKLLTPICCMRSVKLNRNLKNK